MTIFPCGAGAGRDRGIRKRIVTITFRNRGGAREDRAGRQAGRDRGRHGCGRASTTDRSADLVFPRAAAVSGQRDGTAAVAAVLSRTPRAGSVPVRRTLTVRQGGGTVPGTAVLAGGGGEGSAGVQELVVM